MNGHIKFIIKPMAHHNSDLGSTNLIGMVLTIAGIIYAKITASDLAACLTGLLAIINIVIAWPKLKLRLRDIFKNKV